MNLDDLKAKIGTFDVESFEDVADLDEVRQNVMHSRRSIDLRDVRETIVCVLVFVVFSPIVYSEMPLLTRFGSLFSCMAAVSIAVSLYRGRRRHRVLPELSVQEFLRAEIAHLDYQIQLLCSVSWWYLAPIAIGYLCFVWGLVPIPEAIVASVAYFVLDRVVFWFSQRAIRKYLQPQKIELLRVYNAFHDVEL